MYLGTEQLMSMHAAKIRVLPHATCVKAGTPAQIDLQASTGYKDFIFGGEATYDSGKQDVTKWSAGVGAF